MSFISNLLFQLQILHGALWGFVTLHFANFLPKLRVKHVNMSGKNIIVTGANAGIGLELSRQLAEMGATVYMACRNLDKARKALETIKRRVPKANVHVLELDNASLSSVRSFAAEWAATGKQIDVILHNAGIPTPPAGQPYTVDGFESIYQINFLSSFLMTHLLERFLSPTARIVFTTSHASYGGVINSNFSLERRAHVIETGFHTGNPGSAGAFYLNSKLMQVLLARALQRRFNQDPKTRGRSANAFGPGFTQTDIFQVIGPVDFAKDPLFVYLKVLEKLGLCISTEQGAATGVFLATDPGKSVMKTSAGGYWDRLARWMNTKADQFSDETVDRLWIRWSADAGIEWL